MRLGARICGPDTRKPRPLRDVASWQKGAPPPRSYKLLATNKIGQDRLEPPNAELRGARLSSPACQNQRLTQCDRRSRQCAVEALQGIWSCPILRTAHDPYKAATPPLTHRPYQITTHPSPFASTPAHGPAAGVAMVLDSGVRLDRRRDRSRRTAPETRGYPGIAANGGDQQPWRHGRAGQQLWKGWLGVITACGCTPGTGTGCPAEWSATSICMLSAGRPTRR